MGVKFRKVKSQISGILILFLLIMSLGGCGNSKKKDDQVKKDSVEMEQQEVSADSSATDSRVGVPINPEPTGQEAKATAEAETTSEANATPEAESTEGKSSEEGTEGSSTEAADVTPKDNYKTMVEKTLLSAGNNYRLKKAIEKAKNGEDVTIAYIGGSITEGANSVESKNYVTLSYEHFRDTYAKDPSKVHLVNAGMSGTPSSLGVIRYDRDVVENAPSQPDVVFIEFSVNDYKECTNGKATESLIRKILNADNQPAVVLLFAVFKSRWNMQDNYIPEGKYYDLPMISIRNGVNWALDTEKFLTETEYFSDDFHPTDYGHQIMSDCISYLWDTVDAQEQSEKIEVPEKPRLGNDFESIHMVTAKKIYGDEKNVTVKPGPFTEVDTETARHNYSKESIFPDNFKCNGKKSGDFYFQAKCKNLMLVYKFSNNKKAGAIDVVMDGKNIATYDSYNPGGWNNAETVLVFHEDEVKEHTFEIHMAKGSENKEFTIYALGYSD